MVASCSYTFSTATELERACNGSNPTGGDALLSQLNLSLTTPTTAAYVGIYGDSHVDRSEDWIPLTVTLPPMGTVASWDASTQSCSNMLRGLHLRVLSADVGSLYLPARKVLSAQLIVTSQTVSARRCPLGRSCDTVWVVSATNEFSTVPEGGRARERTKPANPRA